MILTMTAAMFDFAWSELALIAVVALVVIGPKDLPRVLRTVGHLGAQGARAIAREFQGSLEQMVREAELDEVQQEVEKAAQLQSRRRDRARPSIPAARCSRRCADPDAQQSAGGCRPSRRRRRSRRAQPDAPLPADATGADRQRAGRSRDERRTERRDAGADAIGTHACAMTDREDELEEGKMPLLDHLIELRKRLLYSVAGVPRDVRARAGISAKPIYNFLAQPLADAMGDQSRRPSHLSPI